MGDLRKSRNKLVDCLVKSASGSERSQCKGPEVCLENSKKASVAGMECIIRGRVADEVQRKEGQEVSVPGGHWKHFGFYSELCKKPVKLFTLHRLWAVARTGSIAEPSVKSELPTPVFFHQIAAARSPCPFFLLTERN